MAVIVIMLVEYTIYDFQREVQLIERMSYPDLVEQKDQHQEMIGKVQAYVDDYHANGLDALPI